MDKSSVPCSRRKHVLHRALAALALAAVILAAQPVLSLPLLTALPATAASASAPVRIAVDPSTGRDSYSAVLYNNRNGLPTSEANAILQTEDGFIWIGSYSGLIRYDGNTFERIAPAMNIGSVMCLHADSLNRLWIGTNESGLAMMERGEFRFWSEDDGLGSSKVRSISEDTEGRIYIGTTSGITMIDGDLALHPLTDPRIADVFIEELWPSPDGLLYCLTTDGDCFTLRGGEVQDYLSHTDSSIQNITSILPDPDVPGSVYIGTEGSGLYHGDLRKGADAMERMDIEPLSFVNEMRLIDGHLWICSQTGIGAVYGEEIYCLDELPVTSLIGHMMVDYEGNLWFCASRQGVMKLVSNRFTDLFARFDLPTRVVNSTCMCGDQLFVGTDNGLLVLEENGPVSSVPVTSAVTASGAQQEVTDLLQHLDGVRIRSIIPDSRGRLWISTWHERGLLCYDAGRLLSFTKDDGLLSNRIRAVCETPDGKILVACTGGMNVIEGDRVVSSLGEKDGLANPVSLCVCAAPNGDALLGTNGGGIYIINESGMRNIDTHAGLRSGVVMHIKYDASRHLYWIIAGNSIAYMTEDYQVTTIPNFPYPDNADLYENSSGDIWVLSSDGIYMLPAEELLSGGDLHPVHYGLADGLPCTVTFNSYSELTPEGDLYIAGTAGIAKVNIESALENVTDLKQAVPFVDADGVRIYPDETGAFRLSHDVTRLTIYGFVYNYSLTDPQVSYYLDGFDQEPVTVNRRDLDPVTYTNLPGGSYRFVMELKDALGRESKVLTVPIVKEKSLHEQLWFQFAIFLAGITAVGALMWLYTRRKMQLLEARHLEETERERISNELSLASRIQADMLPNAFPAFPDRSEFEIYASMDPARGVGGDFYDFFLVDDDHLCLVMADVSGKGIPAALFMMASKILLADNALTGKSPAQILTDVNAAICSNNRQEMFVTVWLGILEISTGKLTAANAGHEYPVLKEPGEPFILYKDRHGFVVGGMEDTRYKEYELTLRPGARLFLYTDGLTEATNAANDLFGTDRMLIALNKDPDATPEQVLAIVSTDIDNFVKEAEQFDDLTMLCLQYNGPA